jgi:hypothetical protein
MGLLPASSPGEYAALDNLGGGRGTGVEPSPPRPRCSSELWRTWFLAKAAEGARPRWTDGAPAPLAGGLHNPFSVKRQGRNAGHIAAAGAVGAVERLMTPTMAVPSCRSSRGFQNRPSSAGPIILTPHLLLPSSFGLPFCFLLVDSVLGTIFGKISETYISGDLHSFRPAPTKPTFQC